VIKSWNQYVAERPGQGGKTQVRAHFIDFLRQEEMGKNKVRAQRTSSRWMGRKAKKVFSASTAQKFLKEEGAKIVQRLRERDLSREKFLGLMMDEVFLAKDMLVLVAVGICTDGRKLVLDFVMATTDNYDLCRDMGNRLTKRGFRSATKRALVILDKNDHEKCTRLMNRVHKTQAKVKGEAEYQKLVASATIDQLKRAEILPISGDHCRLGGIINQPAIHDLKEEGEELLTFTRLNVSSRLKRSFPSINRTGSVMNNNRPHPEQITKCSGKADHAERWTATAMRQVDEGFRRVRNYEDYPALMAVLGGLCH